MNNIFDSNSQSFLVIGSIDPSKISAEFNFAVGDSLVLEGADIKIAEIRELTHWLNLKPLSAGVKLAIIAGADKLTNEAANALLKTLEEPPTYAKIVLTTLEEQKILPTIHSRCQKVRLLADPAIDIKEYLSPNEMRDMTIKQKFDWAAKTAELESKDIKEIITAWQMHFRKELLSGTDRIKVLKELNRAKDLLYTNISVKLLLEHLLLQM